jgi:hypothetical protein
MFLYLPKNITLLLCQYRPYWIINVYYIPTHAQISGVNLYYNYSDNFGVNTPSLGSLQVVVAKVMNY